MMLALNVAQAILDVNALAIFIRPPPKWLWFSQNAAEQRMLARHRLFALWCDAAACRCSIGQWGRRIEMLARRVVPHGTALHFARIADCLRHLFQIVLAY